MRFLNIVAFLCAVAENRKKKIAGKGLGLAVFYNYLLLWQPLRLKCRGERLRIKEMTF